MFFCAHSARLFMCTAHAPNAFYYMRLLLCTMYKTMIAPQIRGAWPSHRCFLFLFTGTRTCFLHQVRALVRSCLFMSAFSCVPSSRALARNLALVRALAHYLLFSCALARVCNRALTQWMYESCSLWSNLLCVFVAACVFLQCREIHFECQTCFCFFCRLEMH